VSNNIAAIYSGATVRTAMLRSKDPTYQDRVAQCWYHQLKVLSHRQHSSLISALRNSTGWTQPHRRLVASTLMDLSRLLELFQRWVKCPPWPSTGWEQKHY